MPDQQTTSYKWLAVTAWSRMLVKLIMNQCCQSMHGSVVKQWLKQGLTGQCHKLDGKQKQEQNSENQCYL